MSLEKEVRLKIDPNRGIPVDDVIEMLKGLRSEKVIKILKTSEKIEEKDVKKSDPFTKKQKYKPPSKVTGNTDLPQIRELNEIAAILRSMEPKINSFES